MMSERALRGPRMGPGRPPDGQIREYATSDGSLTYSIRVRWQGERLTVRLGNELEGWNRRLAELRLKQTLEEISAGVWRPPVADLDAEDRDPLFHEFATVWFDRHAADLDASTRSSYSHVLSRYILPEFKDRRLTEIDYESVRRWRDRLRSDAEQLQFAKEQGVTMLDRRGLPRRTYGARTINEALRLLGQVLSRAVESEHYALARNPVVGRSGLRMKSPRKPPREHLEADELVSLIGSADLIDRGITARTLRRANFARERRAEGLSWSRIAEELGCAESTAIHLSRLKPREIGTRQRRAMIVVLGLTGVRASELTSLTWSRIDRTHGRIIVTDAKTAAGVREIYLTPFVKEEIELYRSSLPSPPSNDAAVFPVRGGGPSDRFNLGRRIKHIASGAGEIREARAQAPLPSRIIPHTFRRTFITLAIQAGKDLVFVQTQAGHADWKTTLEIYTQQSVRSVEPGIRRLLDAMFGGEESNRLRDELHRNFDILVGS
jgi:integrase